MNITEMNSAYPALCHEQIEACEKSLADLLKKNHNLKIVVLDDDPTGTQTVHDIMVYTDWWQETLERAFSKPDRLFYILTNSRSFSSSKTAEVHREIAQNLCRASKAANIHFLLISRGDSTLRGHYPLETQTLKETIEKCMDVKFDGEIICPYFKEGGRFTFENVHYVRIGEELIPAGETEFAGDKTFGYKSSHLGEWAEEKTGGAFKSDELIYISLKEIRALDFETIRLKLRLAKNFNKIILNAVCDEDLKVVMPLIYEAIEDGKHFIFRTAASFVKAAGQISSRPLIHLSEFAQSAGALKGIIVAGSHTKVTTSQLEMLTTLPNIKMIEFNQHLVLEGEAAMSGEISRTAELCNCALLSGSSICLQTRRERVDSGSGNKEDELKMAMDISNAIVAVVKAVTVKPDFVVAKGGITSSEIATKALGIKEALVLGQVESGVPVWECGGESRFPGMPYVVFPGNVGSENSLLNIFKGDHINA